MPKTDPAKLRKVTVNLPFGIGGAEWEPDPTERTAAWCLFIELVTRISTQPLDPEKGVLREAFNSLYSLFGSTREILKEAGPNVGAARETLGGIAIAVLNKGVRPFLTKWHPELEEWEMARQQSISRQQHEHAWPQWAKCRSELDKLQVELVSYTNALAEIAGVKA